MRTHGIFLGHRRGGRVVMWTPRPLDQGLRHIWPGRHRWGVGGVGRSGDRPSQSTDPDAPLSGLGTLLPAPGKDRALPRDVVVHLHGAPAEDLAGLHRVIEGHTLARADACSEGGTPGCPSQAGAAEEIPQAPLLGAPSDGAPKSRSLKTELLGRGRPRSGWQEGRGQEGLPGGGSLELQRGAALPWAFLSAFPGVQPLLFVHVPPSGFWGRRELLAIGPQGWVLSRYTDIPPTPAPRALGMVWGRI